MRSISRILNPYLHPFKYLMNMLGTKTKQSTETKNNNGLGSSGSSGDTCVIAAGTVIDGKFKASENVRVDGLIKGEVKCDQRLVMGEKGRIEGDVETADGIIMGTIEGEVKASGTLTLKGQAFIRGSIHAKYLVVEEGARYVGECNISG